MSRKRLQPGDPCPYCYKVLTRQVFKEKRRRKIANAHASREKAKARGTKFGRPRVASYEEIVALRRKGLSMRSIAFETKSSIGSVQRAIKEAGLAGTRGKPVKNLGRSNSVDGYRPWLQHQGAKEGGC